MEEKCISALFFFLSTFCKIYLFVAMHQVNNLPLFSFWIIKLAFVMTERQLLNSMHV